MWTIEFHKNAKKEFNELPVQLRQKFDSLFFRIRNGGFSNLSSDSVKYIGDGIRELRVIGKDGIARSLYVTEAGEILKILVVFVKKTEKTPQEIIKTAQKRRSEQT